MTRRARRLVWAVGALACLNGCSSASAQEDNSATAPTNVPPDRKLRDLTPTDAQSICEWQSARLQRGWCLQNAILKSGFTVPFSSDPEKIDATRKSCATELARCTAPDQVAGAILDCASEIVSKRPECNATVQDTERCTSDLADGFATQPECAALTEASFREVLYRPNPASCMLSGCS